MSKSVTPGTVGARVASRRTGRLGITAARLDAWHVTVTWDDGRATTERIGSLKVIRRLDAIGRRAKIETEIGKLERYYAQTGVRLPREKQARLAALYDERRAMAAS